MTATSTWNVRSLATIVVAAGTLAPLAIAFTKLSTTQIRLVITSAAPGTANGFVQISELQALGDRPMATASAAPSALPDYRYGPSFGGVVNPGRSRSIGACVYSPSDVFHRRSKRSDHRRRSSVARQIGSVR